MPQSAANPSGSTSAISAASALKNLKPEPKKTRKEHAFPRCLGLAFSEVTTALDSLGVRRSLAHFSLAWRTI
jgi:hypothetical protein